MKNCDEKEAVAIAAESVGVSPSEVELEATNGQVLCSHAKSKQANERKQLRVIDKKGALLRYSVPMVAA